MRLTVCTTTTFLEILCCGFWRFSQNLVNDKQNDFSAYACQSAFVFLLVKPKIQAAGTPPKKYHSLIHLNPDVQNKVHFFANLLRNEPIYYVTHYIVISFVTLDSMQLAAVLLKSRHRSLLLFTLYIKKSYIHEIFQFQEINSLLKSSFRLHCIQV